MCQAATAHTAGTKPRVPSGSGGGGGTRMHRLLGCCTLANRLGSVEAQKYVSSDPAAYVTA